VQNTGLEIDDIITAELNVRRPVRVHGGNISSAAKKYGLAERKIIDFSSNVNPLGPSSAGLRAAKRSLEFIDRYPDMETSELRNAIARYFGIKPRQVLCGNGSNGLIHLLPRVFRPQKVLIPMPTFTEYACAVDDAGGEVVPFQLKEREGFRVDPLEMAFALKGVDMAFLCNPNNPTGMLIPKNEMLEIAEYALQNRVRLVVDEAFMDFSESASIIKDAVQSSHLIILRAFTKFFGMPGLRIGYAVSSEETITSLRDVQESWAVNIPAEHAGIAALNDWGYIKDTRRLIEKERDRLLSALRVLPGVETFPCFANFILFKLSISDPAALIERLAEQGLLVRDCSSFPGLDNSYIRIAVRTRRENKQLIKALRKMLIR